MSEDEDESKDLTKTTEALAEEAEEMTRLIERLRRRRRRCFYRPRELTTTTTAVESVEEDRPEDSITTMEASAEDKE